MPGHPSELPKASALGEARGDCRDISLRRDACFCRVVWWQLTGGVDDRRFAADAEGATAHPVAMKLTSRRIPGENALLKSNLAAMDRLRWRTTTWPPYLSGLAQDEGRRPRPTWKSGRIHPASLNVSDRKVRFYGRTAVVTSLAAMQATTGEGDISGNYRYTRVYARDSAGIWKIVSFEAMGDRDQGEHR